MSPERRFRLKQCAVLGALVGILVSQYHPLWGDARQLRAEPWTPVRKTLGATHTLVFVAIGLVVGGAISHLRDE